MKTIVVAEDFSTSRNIIRQTLEKQEYKVLLAEDGREALGYFDGRHIDLLITDYNMPNVNGHQLVDFVRNIEKYRYIPILLLSTETSQTKINDIMELNITGWVKKPFQVEGFLKIVEKALR